MYPKGVWVTVSLCYSNCRPHELEIQTQFMGLVPLGLLCVLPHNFLRGCPLSSYKSDFFYRLLRTHCFLMKKKNKILWAQIRLLYYQKAWGHRASWNLTGRFQWIKLLTQELPWGINQIPPMCFIQAFIKMVSESLIGTCPPAEGNTSLT